MTRHPNSRHSVVSLFVLLRLGITVLAVAGAVFILGCAQDVAEIDDTQPAPLPQSTPDVPATESPALSDTMTSPDGSVVIILPQGRVPAETQFVFREILLSPKVPPPPPPPPRLFRANPGLLRRAPRSRRRDLAAPQPGTGHAGSAADRERLPIGRRGPAPIGGSAV